MQTVVIVIHLMIVLAMIGLVLLQKSEGGGLGMGGGGGGFMTSRGTANVLTRATGDPGGAVLRHQPGPVDPGGLRPQAALDPAAAAPPRAPAAPARSGSRRRRARPARRRHAAAGAGAPAAPSGPQVPRRVKLPKGRGTGPSLLGEVRCEDVETNCPAIRLSRFSTARAGRMAVPHRALVESNSAGLKVEPHGAVHLHHRRRGLLTRQGSRVGGARRAAAGARLQGAPAQARPLSQRRSGHDVALPARRGLRHRRRRRDRPRPRPLRALHRPSGEHAQTTSPPAASTRTSSPRSGAATISAPPSR